MTEPDQAEPLNGGKIVPINHPKCINFPNLMSYLHNLIIELRSVMRYKNATDD